MKLLILVYNNNCLITFLLLIVSYKLKTCCPRLSPIVSYKTQREFQNSFLEDSVLEIKYLIQDNVNKYINADASCVLK